MAFWLLELLEVGEEFWLLELLEVVEDSTGGILAVGIARGGRRIAWVVFWLLELLEVGEQACKNLL